MKTTPFTEKHIILGIKMREFAGRNMPIEYSGIIDEHIAICQNVSVFDVSHMGEFWVRGPQMLAFLQKITSNDVAALVPGKIQYACFPDGDGGIVDDLLVYQYEPEKYILVVNALDMGKDWGWCVSHNMEGAELENSSGNIVQLAIRGPKAISTLQKLMDINFVTIPYYTLEVRTFVGEGNIIISNTGYTGAGGSELYFYPSAADSIWKAIFEAGKRYGTKPISLGARDTLRSEVSFCLHGNDLGDTASPIEAGSGWIIRFVESKDFINHPILEKQRAEGVTRRLIGLEMISHGIPRHGYKLVDGESEKVGVMASGTISPARKIGVGMGYVKPKYSKVGTGICVSTHGQRLRVVVVRLPFRE